MCCNFSIKQMTVWTEPLRRAEQAEQLERWAALMRVDDMPRTEDALEAFRGGDTGTAASLKQAKEGGSC